MLVRLTIVNFALIRELEINLAPGLSIVSGETGAGKSIFLDALGFIAGQRSAREMLRRGADKAEVYAEFTDVMHLLDEELRERLNLSTDDLANDQLILYRCLDQNGRSSAKVNGRPVTISLLKLIGNLLINIHAQDEHISLFELAKQAEILDAYAGADLAGLKNTWQDLRKSRIAALKKLKALGTDPQQRERELSLLDYQIDEIRSSLTSEEQLAQLKERDRELHNLENIKSHLAETIRLLDSENELSALNFLDEALSRLDKAALYSEKLDASAASLAALSEELHSELLGLKNYFLSLSADAGEVAEVHRRMDEWYKLSQKYGDSPREIKAYLEEIQKAADELRNSEERFSAVKAVIQEQQVQAKILAEKMHVLREKAAKNLALAIQKSLQDLNMQGVDFVVKLRLAEPEEANYWGVNGRDVIEFYISTNKGEELMPLAKIASGGETSRILLAIKAILSDIDNTPVLIFDEIDSGISGDTAIKVGQKLKSISRKRQVVAVSHTAQIAAMADNHIYIYKEVKGERTETQAEILPKDARLAELARLLVGNSQDKNALELAGKLLQQYNIN